MQQQHVMIDIETLATSTDAAILSIGACVFQLGPNAPLAGSQDGSTILIGIPESYYHECAAPWDYRIARETCDWWAGQPDEAKDALRLNARFTPESALDTLDKWMFSQGFTRSFDSNGDCVWANSPSFDCAILRHAASVERSSETDIAWTFRQERDCRTHAWLFDNLHSNAREDLPLDGLILHRADHDAIRQARILQYVEQRRRA